jgi:hypothetical protein
MCRNELWEEVVIYLPPAGSAGPILLRQQLSSMYCSNKLQNLPVLQPATSCQKCAQTLLPHRGAPRHSTRSTRDAVTLAALES